MKVFKVECNGSDEAHWIAANDPISAINHAIEEELDEEEDRGVMTATELTEDELDKAFINTPKEELELSDEEQEADIAKLDPNSDDSLEPFMNKYYDRVPMREALADAIAEGKEVEVLASTIFME